MSLLVIDVGNTQTVIGTYEGDVLTHDWRVATEKSHTADEIRAKLASLFFSDKFDAATVTGAALSSVVPRLTEAWTRAVADLFGLDVLQCRAAAVKGLIDIDYPRPEEIGADRIADSVAARALYGQPVVVVDFGTATNIEVVDERGCFVGGIIAPGVETSAQALFQQATRLADTALVAPSQVVGKSTDQAVQSGIVFGEADRVDGLLRRVFAQLGYTAPVVATGGLATVIAQHSECITETNPTLTLEGLRLIFERNA
ncbi:MAG: type III pantothenate kinase [Coriobacteriia bacterium]|nr:type III pantothenate kinase [Coriobacteriia bacterium]